MVKIFLTLSEGENSIETTRQLLSNNYEYDPFQIFKHLDLCFKNKIDAHDILTFLISKNIIVNEKEVNLLILFYDINGDGNLSYFEFLKILYKVKIILNQINLFLKIIINYLLI
jgi:Ca2+-binding EF-hand superfamily protein